VTWCRWHRKHERWKTKTL